MNHIKKFKLFAASSRRHSFYISVVGPKLFYGTGHVLTAEYLSPADCRRNMLRRSLILSRESHKKREPRKRYKEVGDEIMAEEWWDRKWFWALCVLLPPLIALFVPRVFGVSQTEALIRAVPLSRSQWCLPTTSGVRGPSTSTD